MKMLVDFLPIIVFFAVYKMVDIYAATAAAIAATVLQLVWLKLTGKRIEMMNWLSLGIIVVFGGATLLLHDDSFVKWKPTVLYWVFAIVLAGSAALRKKNLVKAMLGEQIELPDPVWANLNRVWIGFFLLMGLLNIVVAMRFPTDIWVNFKMWGSLGLTLLFMLGQGVYLSRHIVEAKPD
jgi:intracellular septation protein